MPPELTLKDSEALNWSQSSHFFVVDFEHRAYCFTNFIFESEHKVHC